MVSLSIYCADGGEIPLAASLTFLAQDFRICARPRVSDVIWRTLTINSKPPVKKLAYVAITAGVAEVGKYPKGDSFSASIAELENFARCNSSYVHLNVEVVVKSRKVNRMP